MAMKTNLQQISHVQLTQPDFNLDHLTETESEKRILRKFLKPELIDVMLLNVLYATRAELKRLLQHPELFPDGTSHHFTREMEILLRNVLHDGQLLEISEQSVEHELQKDIEEYREEVLPNYDKFRTMWQQFLHHSAPGSGIPKDQMDQQGCTQMITASGSLLLMNRRSEHNDFSRFLEEVCLNPSKILDTRIPNPSLQRTPHRLGRNCFRRGR